MSIIYKTFVAGADCFVYDRNRNKILGISREQYDALNSTNGQDKDHVIKNFQNNGFLEESSLEEVENPMTGFLEQFINQQMTQLILQVTQDCNLRCSYCYYVNDTYENRRHSKKDLDFDIAKKAMDYFISQSSGRDLIFVGFYGGEPLMRFEFIKKCVEYMENRVSDRKVFFTITSNGTMLTDEIIEYFIEHDVHMMISLDGNKDTHDRNRVFPNGKGSFDIIMKKISNLKDKYPNYFNTVTFNTVISPEMDVSEVRSYYETDHLLNDASFTTSTIQDFYNDAPPRYDDRFYIDSNYASLKAALCYAGVLEIDDIPVIYRSYVLAYEKLIENLHTDFIMPKKYHHGGPCIAGSRRLFVDVNGDFFPCERVSENSIPMHIGTVDTGLDINRINNLINVGKVTENECKNCWALPQCKVCAAYADNLEELDKAKKLTVCSRFKNGILEDFKTVCIARKM